LFWQFSLILHRKAAQSSSTAAAAALRLPAPASSVGLVQTITIFEGVFWNPDFNWSQKNS
jgi:hypothetical protein